MEVGQAIKKANSEHKIHSIYFTQIHKSIQFIIPYLEQRQECAKKLYEFRHIITDAEISNYEEWIKVCESEIVKILNFITE